MKSVQIHLYSISLAAPCKSRSLPGSGGNWYNSPVETRNPALKLFLAALLAAACAPQARTAWQEDSLCRDIKKPFFSVTCGAGGACLASPARASSVAQPFGVPKSKNTRRVFILGESVASLLASGDDPVENSPGLEIVNCGMGGYDSRRIAGVMAEALKHEPDLLVVLSGNNERGAPPCPGLYENLLRRGERLLERYYAWRHGAARARQLASLRLHGRRLAAMAAEARKKKVPVVFCTLPANLAGMPPAGYPPENARSLRLGLLALAGGRHAAAAALFAESAAEYPADPFARFYLGRALAADGKKEEAAAAYREALELDGLSNRATAERNRLVRETAARTGAGLADLEAAFSRLAPAGLTGFAQFSDAIHWRPAYNRFAWDEVLRAAKETGAEGFGAPSGRRPPAGTAEEEFRRTFSYSVAYLDEAFNGAGALAPAGEARGAVYERALAVMDFLEKEKPGRLEKPALSREAFDRLFMRNSWSAGTATRLEALRPVYLAHLAELALRRGAHARALALADASLAVQPLRAFARFIRVRALLGLNRKTEAAIDLAALYAAPETRREADFTASLHGLPSPGAQVSPSDKALSKKLSDSAVARLRSGDRAGARPLLERAAALNPANAEGLLTLCGLRLSAGDMRGALDSCALAAWGADKYYPAMGGRMRAEASYARAKALSGLGKTEAAAAELKALLDAAPKDWESLAAARADLKRLGGG